MSSSTWQEAPRMGALIQPRHCFCSKTTSGRTEVLKFCLLLTQRSLSFCKIIIKILMMMMVVGRQRRGVGRELQDTQQPFLSCWQVTSCTDNSHQYLRGDANWLIFMGTRVLFYKPFCFLLHWLSSRRSPDMLTSPAPPSTVLRGRVDVDSESHQWFKWVPWWIMWWSVESFFPTPCWCFSLDFHVFGCHKVGDLNQHMTSN